MSNATTKTIDAPPSATTAAPAWLPVQIDQIPEEMRTKNRWVTWRAEFRNGKWTKVPYQANRNAKAKSNSPSTWGPFPLAVLGARCTNRDGIGYVFAAEDRESGIDLDHCRDPDTGAIDQWAQEILARFPSYAEVSPSRTGIKIFVRGTVSSGTKKGNVEVYPSGRYFTVTGHRLPNHPNTIVNCQEALTALYEELKANGQQTAPPKDDDDRPPAQPQNLPDDRVIEVARAAKNGAEFSLLWAGTWEGTYPSQSEADLALCNMLAFYTGRAPERVDSLFRRSGLFRADKWDAKHHSNGDTYGQATVKKAIEGRTDFYRPKRERKTKQSHITAAGGFLFALTDTGNAERLVARHGRNIHYVYEWDKFLTWDGQQWNENTPHLVEQYTKETARSILADAAKVQDDDARDALIAWAKASESATRRQAMLRLAHSEPGVPIDPSDLDKNPWLLNCANGTLDLQTGQLRPHHRDDHLAKLCPTVFDATAECALWMAFQHRICAGNQALIAFKQRLYGLCLSGDVSEHIIAILYGRGANGKSVEIETIMGVMGDDYAMKGAADLLMAKRNESHPTERADLFGKRLVACVESAEGKRLAESLVKELTGGDTIRARRMREDFWQFAPTHKIVLATNHKPTVRGTDYGMWRRIRLIPFAITIPKAEQDKRLTQKLQAERAGILAWCVRGCLDWQQHGLGEVEAIDKATSEYQEEQDVLGGFLSECCIPGDYTATANNLFAAYVEWSGEKKISPKAFGTALKERGAEPFRGARGVRMWKGLGLRSG